MSRFPITTQLLAAVLLSGCVTPPMGPTAMVMPAPGKPFEAFAQDQALCKKFAGGEIDGGATISNFKQLGTVAVSAALGAGLGAAVRGRRGAEYGGGLGAIGGTVAAAGGSARDQYSLQGRYDMAYTQCMYSRGNQVASATRAAPRIAYGAPATPRGAYMPPAAPRIAYGPSAGSSPPASTDWPQDPDRRRGQGWPPPGYDPEGPQLVR